MAETAIATPPKEAAETKQPQEAASQQQGTPQGSFLDPDVLIVLFLAVVIDILDVVLALGGVVNLILGVPIILWMVWKTGRVEAGKEQVQRVRQAPQERAAFAQRQQQMLAAKRTATRRAWRRGILYFLGGLVPIMSIFVLWTWAVVNTVRGK